jgi:3-polyprenyl-4-hydroxybenzoate decarboxylase
MSLRDYLNKIRQQGGLIEIKKPISKRLALAGLLKALEPSPVLCRQVV